MRQAQRFQDELAERSIASIFQPIHLEIFELASSEMTRNKRENPPHWGGIWQSAPK
jgi:hypothetical protein